VFLDVLSMCNGNTVQLA